MSFFKKDLEMVNGFDEDFEGWGGEDVDLALRLYRSGIKRKLVYGNCIIYHLNHPMRSPLEKTVALLNASIQNLDRKVCKNGIQKL
jgi:GT2 family glycosyltransferase